MFLVICEFLAVNYCSIFVYDKMYFVFRNQNWDYLHNHELEGNTGFYWVKSLDRTIKLFEESIAIAPQ